MQVVREIISVEPEILFSFWGLSIADSTMATLFIALVVLCIGIFFIRRFTLIPTRAQLIAEAIYVGAYDLIGNIINDDAKTRKAFPLIGALLFYLVFANLIGLVPGMEQVTWNGVALFRTATSDFNTTFGLALAAIIIINIISIREKGVVGYLEQFFKFRAVWQGFRKSIGDGFLAVVEFFIGLLDIVGEAVKVVSLSLRLFGNMLAGQIIMIILLGFIAVIIPSAWLAMNLLVGVLQAVVFASLVASYYALATDGAETPAEAVK
jgi:F-type H+-transporting ATPase subunit a